jgi:hypothetical protein
LRRVFRLYVRRDWRGALCRFLLRDLWKKRDLFRLSGKLEELLEVSFFRLLEWLISLSLDFNHRFFRNRVLRCIENARFGDW